jgi:hypothetical protein
MKNKPLIKKLLYSLIIVFTLILACFIIPLPPPFEGTIFPLIAILGLIFLTIGIILTITARKEKGKLKLFLMLTGISAISPFLFSILHNLFYGLAETIESLRYIFEALHAASFIISIIIAPILFIIGVIGSIIYLRSKTDPTSQ